MANENITDFRIVENGPALGLHKPRQRLCKAVHATFNQPHAFLLDMGDQHQGCRRKVGRGSAIRRIAPKELTQARVIKLLREGAPEGREGLRAQHVCKAGLPHQAIGRGFVTAHERMLQRVMDSAGLLTKSEIAPPFIRRCKLRNGIGGFRARRK